MTREKKAKPPIAETADVLAWIGKHDMSLYAEGVSLPRAAIMFRNETGTVVGSKRLGEIRRTEGCCDFWGQKRRVAMTRINVLREEEWDAIRRFAGMNQGLLAVASSIEFVARIMRAEGLAANPQLLQNSTSFMAKWQAARKS